MDIRKATEENLAEAAKLLTAGGVAVIPTDTVYGLAAAVDHPDAVGRLYQIKGRAHAKPIALLAADLAAAEKLVGPFPPAAKELATKYWPGALTLIVGSEGFRVPDHAWTRRLLALCGGCLRVTSANLSGQRAATDAEDALAAVGLSADLVIDDGVSPGGAASTVVKVESNGSLTILREGPIKL